MNKNYVYLAGPIEGCNDNEINDWRIHVKEQFLENIVGVTPVRLDYPVTKRSHYTHDLRKKEIFTKNFMDVQRCDATLAFLPKEINERRPSYGTIFEIAWAASLNKPIFLVTDDQRLIDHPATYSSVPWLYFYDFEKMDIMEERWVFDEAIDDINELLGIYK
jgi:nucleoside 2-deoxyribosyltransferase|tara:strand:- start:3436 stop:3921 length:486 start_codon:yes stop_codon:yes gene_type:complete